MPQVLYWISWGLNVQPLGTSALAQIRDIQVYDQWEHGLAPGIPKFGADYQEVSCVRI